MAIFDAIELGKRSLFANQQSIQTAGHNISNSSTKGYTRQRVNLDSFEPLYRPDLSRVQTPGQVGQGVKIASIKRLKDELLDSRIIQTQDDLGYWDTRNSYIALLEGVHNEPEDISVRSRLDEFWEGWQELSLYPESDAARQVVRTRSETLTDAIHHQYKGFQDIRDMIEGDIEAVVKEVNDLTSRIAILNEEIVKSKAMEDNPNDLMDKRDVLTEKLSYLINISVDKRDSDESYVIHTAGLEIVQGGKSRFFDIKASRENDKYADVIWADSGSDAKFESGKLAALLNLRDGDVRDEIRKLDTMTMNFVDLVNDVHRNAMSPTGKTGIDFFKEQYFINNTLGNFDRNGDGDYDSSYIFRVTGKNTLDAREQVGLEGTIRLSSAEGIVEVPYKATDMVSEVLQRINKSGAEVAAYLDQNNKLVLKGLTSANKENPDFVIRHIEDSGRFLAGYSGVLSNAGEEGAYSWTKANAVTAFESSQYAVSPISHPSAWMEINPVIKNDIQNIASGYKGDEGKVLAGDNRAALAIASIRNNPVMIGTSRTFDDFFADSITEIGLKGEQAQLSFSTQSAIVKELHDIRDSISGVNIDEELSDIMKFQHGYNASARFISAVNEMIDTVINRLGV